MKMKLAMLIVASLLVACNSQNNKEKAVSPEAPVEKHDGPTEKKTGLVLNNGAKWKADSTTVLNVALLQNIVSGARKGSVEDYIQTASQLQYGLNKMVNECRMKGPDHDALHRWLEPLMEKTNELKKATTIDHAATTLGEIEKHINLFEQYFEKS
jgi:hypothetical protein